jgi:hypothetical protein
MPMIHLASSWLLHMYQNVHGTHSEPCRTDDWLIARMPGLILYNRRWSIGIYVPNISDSHTVGGNKKITSSGKGPEKLVDSKNSCFGPNLCIRCKHKPRKFRWVPCATGRLNFCAGLAPNRFSSDSHWSEICWTVFKYMYFTDSQSPLHVWWGEESTGARRSVLLRFWIVKA